MTMNWREERKTQAWKLDGELQSKRLLAAMDRIGITVEQMAYMLDIKPQTFLRRACRQSVFCVDDLMKIARAMPIPREELATIFFSSEVQDAVDHFQDLIVIVQETVEEVREGNRPASDIWPRYGRVVSAAEELEKKYGYTGTEEELAKLQPVLLEFLGKKTA